MNCPRLTSGSFLSSESDIAISVAAAATAAVVTAVAVPEEDEKDKNYYPYVAIVKNVAEASHNVIVLSLT